MLAIVASIRSGDRLFIVFEIVEGVVRELRVDLEDKVVEVADFLSVFHRAGLAVDSRFTKSIDYK